MSRKHHPCPPPEVLDDFGDSWDFAMPRPPTMFSFGALLTVAILVGWFGTWTRLLAALWQ